MVVNPLSTTCHVGANGSAEGTSYDNDDGDDDWELLSDPESDYDSDKNRRKRPFAIIAWVHPYSYYKRSSFQFRAPSLTSRILITFTTTLITFATCGSTSY